MVNTVTQRTLRGGGSDKNIVRLVHIVSDGTEEAALVVFDNSAFIGDVTKGTILEVIATGNTAVCKLAFDQTADSPAIAIQTGDGHVDLTKLGGITNPNGTGATGDIVLTTTGLDAADEVTLIFKVRQ